MATKATEIKGKSLTEQAKSIALRSLEYCDRLKKAIGKKKTEKLQRLGEELASAKKGSKTLHNPFESIKSEDEDLKVSTSDTNLLEEVNKKLSEGALEEHSVEFFLKKINEKTTKAIASKRDEISKAYQDWKKTQHAASFSLSIYGFVNLHSFSIENYLKKNTTAYLTLITTTQVTFSCPALLVL